MKNLDKKDIDQEVFELYDQYAHNKIERREFVKKLSAYAVGGFTVSSLLSFVMPDYKNSIQIKDGQFYTVSDVNQDNFNDVLQTLFFAYKGGNIDNLAKVQAKKDNVRRLKQRASSSRIAGQQNGSGSKITKLGDL